MPLCGTGVSAPRFARLLIPLLIAANVAGCGADSEGRRLAFWAMGGEGEAVRALVGDFERSHPEIRLDVQQIPWSAAHEKLLTAYAGDRLPDVLQLGNTWLPEFVALRALEPLNDRFDAGCLPRDDFFAAVLEANRLDGQLYGIPWYVDTRVLFYRSDLLQSAGFRDPPRTWTQWWSALARIKANGGADRHAILLPMGEWQAPVILAMQLGSPLLRDGGRFGDFRGAPFRRAFGSYLELFRKGWAPAVETTGAGNLYQEFGRGMFAFLLSGPWTIGEFNKRLPAELSGRWATAPLPSPDANSYPGSSLAGGASLVIVRGSRHQDAVWQLIEFLSDPLRQAALYRQTGDLPSRKSAWDIEGLNTKPATRAFRIQMDKLLPLPRVPEWEQIAAKVGHYSEKAIRGELAEDEALSRLDRDVDRILEKRRWLMERGPQ